MARSRRTPDAGSSTKRLTIAMIGTRGVPAAYGGFETAIEEIGSRLVELGHDVVVYCRATPGSERLRTYKGMRLVYMPALRMKIAETLSHTAFSVLHAVTHKRPDVAFVFNAANSPFLPMLTARGIPVALHVDGLEWKRGKWGPIGQRYYKLAEWLGVKFADSLIADAKGIAAHYRRTFDAPTELLTYGAPIHEAPASDRLRELELEPQGYHLVVARFEPENHVEEIVRGFHVSDARKALVVVGSAPYSAEYTQRIQRVAESDPRIHLLGGVWDQELLDQLYGNAASYLHGHSVGGTNPSLLRAMGSGAPVIAWDVDFNREVIAEHGRFFTSLGSVAREVERNEADAEAEVTRGARLRDRARENYDWDIVSAGYLSLAARLAGAIVPALEPSVPGEAYRPPVDTAVPSPTSVIATGADEMAA